MTTDPPSWITQYAPLATACAALLAALLALAGVWWNNRSAVARQRTDISAAEERQRGDISAAEERQRGDITAAEERRQRDVAAAEARERERHRRENMATHVGDLVGVALGVVPIATQLRGFTHRLRVLPPSTNPADQLALDRDLSDIRTRLFAQHDKLTSLNYQVQMLSPSETLTNVLNDVVKAAAQLSIAAQTGPDEPAQTPEFREGIEDLRDAAQLAVVTYRNEYGDPAHGT